MDFYNNNIHRENFSKEDINKINFNLMDEKKIELFTIQQIELYIQQQVKIKYLNKFLIIFISIKLPFLQLYSSTCQQSQV